jgi:hypothetical protein
MRIKKLFVLESAHYYREAAQYTATGIYTSVALAETYLRSRRRLDCKNQLVPHPFCKNAKFTHDKTKGVYSWRYNDDGVVTAFRLRPLNLISCEKDIPSVKCRTVCGNVETTYSFVDGVTKKRNKIIT